MATAVRGADHGPTWEDVRLMMQEVGAAADKRLDVHMTAAQGVNRAESCVWTVRAWVWGQWGEGNPYAFESGLWPTGEFKSVPALLYNLLHRLDSKLEQRISDEKRKRGPRLPGM